MRHSPFDLRARATLWFALLLAGCQQPGTVKPWFTEEATARGIEYVHVSGFKDHPYLPEITAGGVALFDVENDGDLDLYFVQSGWHLASKPDLTNPDIPANVLYVNDGLGNFSESQSLGALQERGYGMGVATGDYDNDGDTDLYITNLGENALLRNEGNLQFSNVTEEAGLSTPGWSTAAAFSDFDGDGDLDLFVVNYLHWSVANEMHCYARGTLTYCLPTNYDAPAQDSMFRNNGDGTFEEISTFAGMHRAFGNGLGTVPADFNDDGLLDIFVANDTMVNQLWLNQGGFRFADRAFAWACAVDNHGITKAGMGIDTVDIDDDLDQDVIVVNLEGQTDSMFVNENTYFRDRTSRVGLGSGSRRFTRFGVVLADFDNDGVVDLYEANGKVDGDPHNEVDEFAEPNTLLQGIVTNDGLRFIALSSADGTTNPGVHTSRGLALGDIDNDGDLDVVIINRDATPYLLINQVGGDNHWIKFRVMNEHDSDAIGAKVNIRVGSKEQIRTVKVSGSYLSAHDPRVHFGLAAYEEVTDVQVTWPNGTSKYFGSFEANQIIELKPD